MIGLGAIVKQQYTADQLIEVVTNIQLTESSGGLADIVTNIKLTEKEVSTPTDINLTEI